MAISKSFFGLRRGSTKSMTFQVLNGQQITKDRVLGGKNPRSDAQMTQRSQFLSAVRFYERSNRNLFRFAFEDKKQQESEYNAFMRLNAKIGPYITKAQGDAIGFPMVAPWLIAKGSLTPIPVVRYEDFDAETSYLDVVLDTNYTGEVPTTIGEVSALLRVACPQVQELDIITIPSITSTQAGNSFIEDFDAEDITMQNLWGVTQFIVDSNDQREFHATSGLFCEMHGTSLVMTSFIGPRDTIGASAFILSRNTATGLKVATTALSLNLQAEAVYEAMRDNSHREQVLAWWGAQSQAILQGSLATAGEQPTPPSPSPFVPIVSTLTAGSTSVAFATPFASPFAFGDGSVVSVVLVDNSEDVPLRMTEMLTYSGGSMTGVSETDADLGNMTLAQSIGADGKLVLTLTTSKASIASLEARIGVIFTNKIEFDDTFSVPKRKVVSETESLYFTSIIEGVPGLVTFANGDEVKIAVTSATKQAVITCNQYQEEGDDKLLLANDTDFGLGEVKAWLNTICELYVTSDTVKGVEYEVKLVSIKRDGIVYPIANN